MSTATSPSLIKSIQRCVANHSSVTVALSGGVDSVVMLHACVALAKQASSSFTLNAIHIHHGLSPNADQWLLFCQQLCEQYQVGFQYKKVKVQAQARKSLEELARNARYAALDDLACGSSSSGLSAAHAESCSSGLSAAHAESSSPKPSLVLLAQHEDDQAETLLLQLKRGSGPKGLSGMAERFSKNTHVEYARPWINAGVGKQDILAYAQSQQLTWVEDESNQDSSFDRNFLRNEIMPMLSAKWPQISKTIARSASLCASQSQLVEALAAESLAKIQSPNAGLSLTGLAVLPTTLASEVIRLWSASYIASSLSSAQLSEIEKLAQAKADQVGYVQVGQWQCRSFNQRLYWVALADIADKPSVSHYINVEIGEEPLRLCITYGDLHRKVRLYTNRPTKSIKAWMKESAVAPWRRLAMPVVCVNEQIIAIGLNDGLVFVEGSIKSEEQGGDNVALIRHAVADAVRQSL